jgi:hypothetical protein
MALLWATLSQFELAAKSSRARLGRLRRALEGEEAAVRRSRIAPVPQEAR